jgi:hypothetical protein
MCSGAESSTKNSEQHENSCQHHARRSACANQRLQMVAYRVIYLLPTFGRLLGATVEICCAGTNGGGPTSNALRWDRSPLAALMPQQMCQFGSRYLTTAGTSLAGC